MDHELIENWKKCSLKVSPYLFPKDSLELLKEGKEESSKLFQKFDEYTASLNFGTPSDKSLHIGLFPQPYIGNLANATIFILMLNPGFSPSNYFIEQNSSEYKQAYTRNLRQENSDDDYPFIFLNPKFSWHPGFGYWQRKLQTIIEAHSKQSGTTHQKSMMQISQKLACLELFPYPSSGFGSNSLLNKLPSVVLMQKYVRDLVIPKAKEGEAIIIVTRSIKNWNLPKCKNITFYKVSEARSASLSLTSSCGGKAIGKHLGLSIK